MATVQESIELWPTPSWRQLDICVYRPGHSAVGFDRDAAQSSALDVGDSLLGDVRPFGHIRLSHP